MQVEGKNSVVNNVSFKQGAILNRHFRQRTKGQILKENIIQVHIKYGFTCKSDKYSLCFLQKIIGCQELVAIEIQETFITQTPQKLRRQAYVMFTFHGNIRTIAMFDF